MKLGFGFWLNASASAEGQNSAFGRPLVTKHYLAALKLIAGHSDHSQSHTVDSLHSTLLQSFVSKHLYQSLYKQKDMKWDLMKWSDIK